MALQAITSLCTVNCCLIGLAVAAVAIVILLYKVHQAAPTLKHGIPLPPGPPARWFWDNAMPPVRIGRTLANWVAEYGPVIALRQGSHVVVVVGRVDATTEIMEKEGSALVDRPHWIAAGELLSKGLRLAFVSGGERFRRFRKAAHTHLQPKAVKAYQAIQLESAKDVIMDILKDPKNHSAHATRFTASVILRLTYGKSTPTTNDDPEVVRIHEIMKNMQRAMRPGAYLVDRIPWLKYVPGYGRELTEHHKFEIDLFREQMDRVRSEMETHRSGKSFARALLEHTDEHQLSGDEMAYLAGNLYGGGSETTAVAITNMVMAAACHPEAQSRVQEELDIVIGKDRMPSWEDSKSLPQVHAFVFEALRWRPVLPFGLAHRASQDIIWRGRCIPAGATVIGCHWAISRDPAVFPAPEKFDPQRWIDEEGRVRNNMTSYPYGFGRRVCPGRHLADRSLFINLALLLWSFRIVERPDAPIDPDAYSDTLIARAAPFDVEFIPRIEVGRLKEMMSESAM